MERKNTFKVGDLAVVMDKEYLKAHSRQTPTIVGGMYKYAGKTVRIAGFYTASNEDFAYLEDLNGERICCMWNQDWLCPVYEDDVVSSEVFDDLFA